ncbi:hypothetical protein [Labrys wisconsinensis]|uniref:Uncharacterized protein n=1 Tax=Labrys wisconsinensis TaxID=425677 RepID=A0ABU0J5I1_9HYPH|nr:hypothetical protein [Labrys wisconsinensis]MDQ0468539.1 hypothetical protein [Labrys wisconsinensis]
MASHPHKLYYSYCLVDIYKLDEVFAEILLQDGLRSALDSVGATTPIVPTPTYRGDFPPRELEYGEYWYRSPLDAGTFRETSRRGHLVGELSDCLNKARIFEGDLLFKDNYMGAFVSFRAHNEFLYVMIPDKKLLLAAKIID